MAQTQYYTEMYTNDKLYDVCFNEISFGFEINLKSVYIYT